MANEALAKACANVGGQKALADLIGTSQAQVWYWLERSKNGAAAEYVLRIEEKANVSRHLLRPDIYPLDQQAGAA